MKIRRAFTVIELLIVIVIIGILSAVTLVSYTSVTQRATVASLKSDLASASSQLKLYQAENATYPYLIDCSASPAATSICIKNSPGTTYVYRGKVNDFCLSATNNSIVYSITEAGSIISGLCQITNYVTTPGFEGGTGGGGGTIGTNGGISSIQNSGGHTGSYYYHATFTSSTLGHCQYTSTLQPGLYSATFWIRSNKAVTFTMYFDNAFYSNSTYYVDSPSMAQTLTPNTWIKYSRLFNLRNSASVCIGGYVGNYPSWISTDYVDMDSVMVTEGNSSYNFADGSSTGWTWSGTANASTSSGLPL